MRVSGSFPPFLRNEHPPLLFLQATTAATMSASNHRFLSSMTFAQGCSCDECGEQAVPQEIRNAVQAHLKRRKLADGANIEFGRSINISQRRELMGRHGGVSVWKLVLPPSAGGDPIVEYRNSHRIVFVQRLPQVSSIVVTQQTSFSILSFDCYSSLLTLIHQKSAVSSIGRGIIGSASEENDRQLTNWNEGKAYFLPVQKGVACGWIHKSLDAIKVNDSDANSEKVGEGVDRSNGAGQSDAKDEGVEIMSGEATLYILKATDSDLAVDENAPSWAKRTSQLFTRLTTQALEKSDDTKETENAAGGTQGIPLSEEDCAEIAQIVEEIVGSKDPSFSS